MRISLPFVRNRVFIAFESNTAQQSFYVFGSFGYALLYATLLAMHIYRGDPDYPNLSNLPILTSSGLVGVAALVVGAFKIPIVSVIIGYLSDRTQNRLGRRRPFLAIATLPLLLSFVLVSSPLLPYSSPWNALYLKSSLLLFFVAFATYMTAYLALFAEVVRRPAQRMQLSTLIVMSNLLGNAVGLVCAPWLVEHIGFTKMALCFGLIALLSLLAPLAIREDPKLTRPNHFPLRHSVRNILRNAAFRPFIISQFQMWIVINIIYTCSNYLVVVLLGREMSRLTINGSILFGAIIGFFTVNLLTKYWSKKKTLCFFLVGLGSSLVTLSVLPLWINYIPGLFLTAMMMIGATLSGTLILPNPILADIIDEDTRRTGTQKGAIYFGIQITIIAASFGFTSLISSMILMLGKTQPQPFGVQLIFILAGCFSFSAALLLSNISVRKYLF